MSGVRARGTGHSKPSLDRHDRVGWDRGGVVGGWRMGLAGARLLSWPLWRAHTLLSFFVRRELYQSRPHPYGVLAGGRQYRAH